MRLKWVALSAALSAVLFGALNLPAQQIVIGPNSQGGWNAYKRDPSAKIWTDAQTAAEATFPGWTLNGVQVIPANSTKGHLLTLQGKQETDYVFNNLGLGWVGLTDADDWADKGAYEMGNTSGAVLPAYKDGSTELRNVPASGERGEGFIWVTGEPFEYQPWNGGEPNDSSGEDYIQLVNNGGPVMNDLPATSTDASLIEWDLKLAEHPIQVTAALAAEGGKLVGKAAARVTASPATAIPGVQWVVSEKFTQVLSPAGADYGQGTVLEWWNGPNINSTAAWSAASPTPGTYTSNTVPSTAPFRWDNPINLRNGDEAAGVTAIYPTQFNATGDFANFENYSLRFSGELFVPQGTVNFRDHNDDYAYLAIDGQQLISDNDWTSWDGTGNTKGGVGTFVNNLGDATHEGQKGHWYTVDFRMAEGGGGDSARLLWDVTDIADPDDAPSVENPDFVTIPKTSFRSKMPEVKIERQLPLGSIATSVDGTSTGLGWAGAQSVGNFDGNGAFNLTVPQGTHTYVLSATIGGVTQTAEVTATGSTGTPPTIQGDVNGDNKVDLTDFGILKENFGKSGPVGAASVPEPSTLALLGLGGLWGLVGLVRRNRK
jgi:hypothetical protein